MRTRLFLAVETPTESLLPSKPRLHYCDVSRMWFFHMLGSEMRIAADKTYYVNDQDQYYKNPAYSKSVHRFYEKYDKDWMNEMYPRS